MRPLDVVGIGSMVVDRVHHVPRIGSGDEKVRLLDFPGAGPVRKSVGGVILNQLGWAAALGVQTGIFGRQGNDSNGRFLRAAMDRGGIARSIDLVSDATSLAEIFVDVEGERVIYMAAGATATTTPEHVRSHEVFVRGASRLTTEVSQLPLEVVRTALDLAAAHGLESVLDLDVPPSVALASGLGTQDELDAVLRLPTLLKPSKSAAAELVPETAGDALAMARALRDRFEVPTVVVTDGAAGCAIATEGLETWVAGEALKARDTTGAGDAFLGGLVAGLQRELGWEAALRLANAAGGACVEQWGAFPTAAASCLERVEALYGKSLALPLAAQGAELDLRHDALEALDIVVEELGALRDRLGPAVFDRALALIHESQARGGRVHVTGVGKCEHVAHYAASLLSSTGTPAAFLHATEAVHGSAGQLVAGDIVIAISNSGNTAELRAAVEAARAMNARILGVTGGLESWLATEADVCLDAGVAREGGGLGLAPRASVAAEVVVLAALSAALEGAAGLDKADYHRRHPAGNLGRLSSS